MPATSAVRENHTSMGTPDWWERRRFGMFVDVNIATVPAWAPIGQSADCYRAHLDESVTAGLLCPSQNVMVETLAHHRDRWGHIDRYDEFLPLLTFEQYDPQSWVNLARDAGMGYAVMTAKHHDGLCWWDAPNAAKTVVSDGPRRNVLAEFASECDRADITFGTYYSLLDWHAERNSPDLFADEVIHPQVADLVERYGSRFMWGDGHWAAGEGGRRTDELLAKLRNVYPGLIVNDRWPLSGSSVQSWDFQVPDEITPAPWEIRRGIATGFGFNRSERYDDHLSPTQIIALLTEVIAKNGHLLLGVGPDSTGCIPQVQAEPLRAAGVWVHRHQNLVERGRPWKVWGDQTSRFIDVDGELHAVDIAGNGRFAELKESAGRVVGVTRIDGSAVNFTQGEIELTLLRPHNFIVEFATVYRITMEAIPSPPPQLFTPAPRESHDLQSILSGAALGEIVQLSDGLYLGPATVPAGVTVRGLGPDRTTIESSVGCAITLSDKSRLEHCSVTGVGSDHRIDRLPHFSVRVAGAAGAVVGCRVHGHIDVVAPDARVVSSSATGVVCNGQDHLTVSRSTFSGTQWDTAIEISGGYSHRIESCEIANVLTGIRLKKTIGATVRGNRITARWWGVVVVDCEGTLAAGNTVDHTMRAFDVDGGTLAEITGNSVTNGDSGCIVQRGAAETVIAGNRWERCRVGLLAWGAGWVRHRDNTAIDLTEHDAEVSIGP